MVKYETWQCNVIYPLQSSMWESVIPECDGWW